MSTEALASLYSTRLHSSQIRLLRLLPSTCPDCGHVHLDTDDSSLQLHDDDSRTLTNDGSSLCANSDVRIHDACRGRGCTRCDKIRCQLVVTALDDVAGQFDALSYVWGCSSSKETIVVDGIHIPTTRNLEAALRRVRNTEKASLVWVDAICINQADIDEKNTQIMRIGHIFKSSRRALAWMGEAINDHDQVLGPDFTRHAENAVALLKKIQLLAQRTNLVAKSDPYQMFVEHTFPFTDPVHLGLPTTYSSEWESLGKFLDRSWFSRVWVIQEVASASATTLLVGNNEQIDWSQTADAVLWLLTHSYPDNIPGLHNCWNILIIDTCRKEPTAPLLRRMSPTASFNCTLPHDQIFALLGITAEGQALDKYPRLRVDYGRNWRELYRDVVRHCIETPGSFGPMRTLHALSHVQHTRNLNGDFAWQESSWVPSWNEGNQQCPIAWRGYAFKATRESEATMIDSTDARILSLHGVAVDKIAKVYTYLVNVEEEDGAFISLNVFRAVAKTWAAIIQNWKVSFHHRYPHLADAFAKVLAIGPVSKHPSSEGSPGMYFAAYWQMGLPLLDAVDTKIQISNFTGPVRTDVEVWDHMHELLRDRRIDYLELMARDFATAIELQKVVFITEKGYIGTGPSITSPGDEVCVLYGGTTPYIVQRMKKGHDVPDWLDISDASSSTSTGKLRSSVKSLLPFGKKAAKRATEERAQYSAGGSALDSVPQRGLYRFVGDCYVEGLMSGEALDRRDAGELHEKTFHLV